MGEKINVNGAEISLFNDGHNDFISLTDMAKSQSQEVIIIKWLSLKSTIEYIGEWEALHNPDFNYTEFGTIKNESGSNNFVLSVKNWIALTNAIGLTAKAGRYGGTYGHKDIAFHFGMWISPKFQLLLVKEFQRLKLEESNRLMIEWNFHRMLSKINYKIHTDAIKENLIPKELNKSQTTKVYASEAEVLNMALFGLTSKQWRIENPGLKGNLRDLATIQQLVVLSNLESINAMLIEQKINQKDRLILLNKSAIKQMMSLIGNRHFLDLNK